MSWDCGRQPTSNAVGQEGNRTGNFDVSRKRWSRRGRKVLSRKGPNAEVHGKRGRSRRVEVGLQKKQKGVKTGALERRATRDGPNGVKRRTSEWRNWGGSWSGCGATWERKLSLMKRKGSGELDLSFLTLHGQKILGKLLGGGAPALGWADSSWEANWSLSGEGVISSHGGSGGRSLGSARQ